MLTGVLGEAQDRVLGRHVGAVPGHRGVRRHGAHVDDGAPRHAPLRVPRAHGPGFLRLHRVDLGPHAVEHAFAVDAHHAVEVVETLVREVKPRRRRDLARATSASAERSSTPFPLPPGPGRRTYPGAIDSVVDPPELRARCPHHGLDVRFARDVHVDGDGAVVRVRGQGEALAGRPFGGSLVQVREGDPGGPVFSELVRAGAADAAPWGGQCWSRDGGWMGPGGGCDTCSGHEGVAVDIHAGRFVVLYTYLAEISAICTYTWLPMYCRPSFRHTDFSKGYECWDRPVKAISMYIVRKYI